MEDRDRAAGETLAEVLGLMRTLRGPDGCPWDREQTLQSLRRWLLEESHEVLEAIDADDRESLREELGDLLLQIVFQSQITAEEGAFDAADVVAGLRAKLLERHPHVFGDERLATADEVSAAWEARKARAHRESGARQSALDGVPPALPGLARARRIQEKAARVGFEWPSLREVWAKLDEELAELREAAAQGDRARIGAELGDVLFACVNLGRFLDLDAEDCLRQTIRTFGRRFRHLEASGDLTQMNLAAMLASWQDAKRAEPGP